MKKSPFVEKNTVRFLVLIPHPDIQRIARQYSGELLRAGWEGARLFPPVIPLAVLEKPLPVPMVQRAAFNLALAQNQEEGIPFFSPRGWDTLIIPPFIQIGGISFSVPSIEKWLPQGLYRQALSPILALTLFTQSPGKIRDEDPARRIEFSVPALRFRAAALANCVIHLGKIQGKFYEPQQGKPSPPSFRVPVLFSEETPEGKEGNSYYSRWIIGKPCWLPKKPSLSKELS